MKVRVLVVALEAHRQAQMVNDLGRVVRAGADGLLVTRSLLGWPRLPRQVIAMETERWHEQPLAASAIALLPPALQGTGVAQALVRRRVGWRTTVIGTPPGAVLHPYLDWLVVKRMHLQVIDAASLTHVVPTTAAAWPIAWHLARLNPCVAITSGVDNRALQQTT